MGRKLQAVEVVRAEEAGRHALPERVMVALGELVGAAQEGLLALSVGVGLGVLAELMEEEVDEVVGPRSKPDPARFAFRHGHQRGEVVLGGRVVSVERPRVRRADGSGELELETYRHFADRDPLDRVVLERMLAGVSCRRYPRTQEPVGEAVEREARSVSRSALSRRFKERTRQALEQLVSRRLESVELAALMLDGIELQGRTNVVALGIGVDGTKRLGVTGPLKAVLASTNPIESMIEIVRATQRNVKRWRSGEMALRWTAAGMLEAERQFRRVVGYRDLPKLLTAIDRELHPSKEAPMIAAA